MIDLSSPTPFLPEKRVYSRTRVVGKPGFPGKGMGGTLILAGPNEYHPLAQFTFGNDYTYSFRPERVDHGMEDGELYPTHFAYTSRYNGARKLESTVPPTLLHSSEDFDVFTNKAPAFKLGAQTIAFKLKTNINRKVVALAAKTSEEQARVISDARAKKAFGETANSMNLTTSQIPVQLDHQEQVWEQRLKRADRLAGQNTKPQDSK